MVFKYLYYRYYQFFEKQNFRKNPKAKARGIIVGILALNVFTILSIVKEYLYEFTISPLIFILIPILLIILTTIILNNTLSDKIIQAYSNYTSRQLLVRRIFSNTYIAGSIILFFKFMENLT